MPPLSKFSKSCLAAAIGHSIITAPLQAATITVTNIGDGFGSCTLRDAVTTVNTGANSGNCMASGTLGSQDQIEFDLPNPSTINLTAGTMQVSNPVTIQGPGQQALTITGFNAPTVFSVFNANDVTIAGLAIKDTQGGIAVTNSDDFSLLDTALTGISTSGFGGGIFINNSDDVEIRDCNISNNVAYSGGGIAALGSDALHVIDTVISNNTTTGESSDGRGGGISFTSDASDSAGTIFLTVEETTISGNTVMGIAAGGGIGIFGGGSISDVGFSVSRSRIFNNYAINGGGIDVGLAFKGTISKSSIFDNTSRNTGGGVRSGYATLVVIDQSTISGNTASLGGGLYSHRLRLSNSTISNNEASTGASGIYHSYFGYDSEFTNSTIMGNHGAPGLGFGGSDAISKIILVANNVISNHPEGNCGVGNFEVGSVNWTDDATCGIANSGDPMLGELADNGGPTLTHAPLPGSGLAGAGLVSACNSEPIDGVDQRGMVRGSTSCFIGAVEGIVDPSSFFVVPLSNGKSVIFSL